MACIPGLPAVHSPCQPLSPRACTAQTFAVSTVRGDGRARMGEEITCDLPDGADDHGLVGSRPKQVAVAGAVAPLRVIPGVLQHWGCRATDKILLQQLSTGQDDTVISESYAEPVGRNAAVRCSCDGEGEETKMQHVLGALESLLLLASALHDGTP